MNLNVEPVVPYLLNFSANRGGAPPPQKMYSICRYERGQIWMKSFIIGTHIKCFHFVGHRFYSSENALSRPYINNLYIQCLITFLEGMCCYLVVQAVLITTGIKR